MDIGIHGTTHRMLSACTFEEVVWEFSACKEYLEALLNKPVKIAALPGGDINHTVIKGAQQAGVELICTSIPGFNTESTSRMRLRRLSIRSGTRAEDLQDYCSFNVRGEVIRWALAGIPRKMLGVRNYTFLRRWLLGDTSNPAKDKLFDP